jgi:hypothetical protein
MKGVRDSMGIQTISSYGGISPYYNRMEIPTVTPEEVKKQDEAASVSPQQPSKTQPLAEDNRSKTADLENISLTFNKEESFDYLGSESGLASLDMQKAISDMKKDSVLQEYQYFVGSSKTLLQSEDGLVFSK